MVRVTTPESFTASRHKILEQSASAPTHHLAAIPTPLTGKVITDITHGTHANRPAAGNLGKIYAETDTKKVFWDDGTEWQDCKVVPPWPTTVTSGDNELANSEFEGARAYTVYTKCKEVDLRDVSGTIKFKWEMKGEHDGDTVYGRIYRNGAAVGVEKATVSPDNVYQEFEDEIAGWSADDLAQLYCYKRAGTYVACKNFRLCVAEDTPTVKDGTPVITAKMGA